MNTNNQKNYDQSFGGRLRTNKQYHFNSITTEAQPIPVFDNFSAKELEMIWNAQKGICPCCGTKINRFENADISHISKNGFFNVNNFQLLHRRCNQAQGSLVLPFIWIKAMKGKYFLELIEETPSLMMEEFSLSKNDLGRFQRLIIDIKDGKI